MRKRNHLQTRILKDVKSFRARQREVPTVNEESRRQQYRELQEILSPYWAWRDASH